VDPVTGCVHLTLRGGDEEFVGLLAAARSSPTDPKFKNGLFAYAHRAHRSLLRHEWAHVLQLATYPALYLRAARSARVMVGPGVFLATNPDRYPLPLRFQMDAEWQLSAMLSTIPFRAVVGDHDVRTEVAKSNVGRGILTERDLLEEDATIFQYRAEISGPGLGRAYRNWLRERPRYSRLFAFLALHFGSDDSALRLLPVMVRAAFSTTRPLESFLTIFGTIMHEGVDFFEDAPTDEDLEDLFLIGLGSKLGTVAADDLSMQKPESGDAHRVIEEGSFLSLIDRFPQLPISPLSNLDANGATGEGGLAREALRHPERFFDRRDPEPREDLLAYWPPAMTISLDHPDFPYGATLLTLSPLLHETAVPGLDGRTYAEWTASVLKSRMLWREILGGADGVNSRCPHSGCGYHKSGLCQGWMTIPATAEDCEFPQFFTLSTKHKLSTDRTALEPVPELEV